MTNKLQVCKVEFSHISKLLIDSSFFILFEGQFCILIGRTHRSICNLYVREAFRALMKLNLLLYLFKKKTDKIFF